MSAPAHSRPFDLADAQPLPFVPFKGALGFFDIPEGVVTP